MILSGKFLANAILEDLKNHIVEAGFSRPTPTLAVFLIGNDPGSISYIKQKQKAAAKIGAKLILKEFPNDISQNSLITQISQINSNPSIHGLIIQRPLPSQIDSLAVAKAVAPKKDVDGFHPDSPFINPLGLAILKILESIYVLENDKTLKDNIEKYQKTDDEDQLSSQYNLLVQKINVIPAVEPESINNQFINWLIHQNILIIGRGETGGKPIANTLNRLKCHITISHSQTSNLNELLKNADIIISAVGKPDVITGDLIKPNAVCIGVGISRTENPERRGVLQYAPTIKLTGDLEEQSVSKIASYYTPTPGGVGPVNVACLFDNLIKDQYTLVKEHKII